VSLDVPATTRIDSREATAPRVAVRASSMRLDIVLAIVVFAMAIVPRAASLSYYHRTTKRVNEPYRNNVL
jgi:hypothetical protein